MRTNSRATTIDMITDPCIPRNSDGVLQLCHGCQRQVYFDGGFIRSLARRLERAARFRHAIPAINLVAALRAPPPQDEAEAFAAICNLRWPDTDGRPVCPYCGSDNPYLLARYTRFSCRDCLKQYSVTSGTALHSHKLSFVELFKIISAIGAERSLLQAASKSGHQLKSLFSIAHRVNSPS